MKVQVENKGKAKLGNLKDMEFKKKKSRFKSKKADYETPTMSPMKGQKSMFTANEDFVNLSPTKKGYNDGVIINNNKSNKVFEKMNLGKVAPTTPN